MAGEVIKIVVDEWGRKHAEGFWAGPGSWPTRPWFNLKPASDDLHDHRPYTMRDGVRWLLDGSGECA